MRIVNYQQFIQYLPFSQLPLYGVWNSPSSFPPSYIMSRVVPDASFILPTSVSVNKKIYNIIYIPDGTSTENSVTPPAEYIRFVKRPDITTVRAEINSSSAQLRTERSTGLLPRLFLETSSKIDRVQPVIEYSTETDIRHESTAFIQSGNEGSTQYNSETPSVKVIMERSTHSSGEEPAISRTETVPVLSVNKTEVRYDPTRSSPTEQVISPNRNMSDTSTHLRDSTKTYAYGMTDVTTPFIPTSTVLRLIPDSGSNDSYFLHPNMSCTKTHQHDHNIEKYLTPSIMACPLIVAIIVIFKMYRKLSQYRFYGDGPIDTPIYRTRLRLSNMESNV